MDMHLFVEFLKFALKAGFVFALLVSIAASIIGNKKSKDIEPIYKKECDKQKQQYINSLDHHRS